MKTTQDELLPTTSSETPSTSELDNPGLKIGWACFHCFAFFPPTREGIEAAMEHFSETPDLPPECLDANSPPRKLARRARAAEKLHQDLLWRNEWDDAAYVMYAELTSLKSEFARRLKVKTATDAFNKFDSVEGRALAAEATLKVIEAKFPNLVAKARRTVEEKRV